MTLCAVFVDITFVRVFDPKDIVLFVKVSVCDSVARVPVVGRVTVPVPATAVALRMVVPDVLPARIRLPTFPACPKVLAPVTVCTPERVMSPPPVALIVKLVPVAESVTFVPAVIVTSVPDEEFNVTGEDAPV